MICVGKAPSPAPIARTELRRARKLIKEDLDVFERGALRALNKLSATYGEVQPLDVDIAAANMPAPAARALREMFDAVAALKREGALEKTTRAEKVSPELLARLERGELSPAVAVHLQKIAALEMYRLFDDPVRDAELHVRVEDVLRDTFHVRTRALRDAEIKPELTLREEDARKSLALRALLTSNALPSALRLEAVARLGAHADSSALPVLEAIAARHPKTELATAAKNAGAAIRKAAKMTIVFASMEVKPYCGTGGLSNVMNELPRALAKMGHKVIVLMPRHAIVDRDALAKTEKGGLVLGPEGPQPFQLYRDQKDGVDFYFIENDRYFSQNRAGIYGNKQGDYPDNAERYDFFGASVPQAIRSILGVKSPDIVQLNDAHTSSAAAYLRRDPTFAKTKTVLAVHNLGGAYQGKFNAEHLRKMRFDRGLYYQGGPAEFFGDLNFLKLGLTQAHASITVSREYMKEILTEQKGEGLHGVLRALHARDRLWGNLNGIDTKVWNPETDVHLAHHYSFADQSGKKLCKSDLQAMFGLPAKPGTPVIGVVARLTEQKGFDDIVKAMRRALEEGRDVQFVICGDGDAKIAAAIQELGKEFPGHIGFDGKFSVDKEHLIYAGSDFFLMPSKFEPCGLPQMYALRYLTVPIVRAVGGLEESIRDFDPEAKSGNGFKFTKDISGAVDRALEWYGGGENARQVLLRNCALSDFSWENTSAVEQVAFYRKVLGR